MDAKLKGFGLSLRDIAPLARTTGIALLAVGIAKFGADAVKAASSLEEAKNLSEVTFGESEEIVQKFADTAAEAFGLSERAALSAAGAFGAIGQAAGLSERGSAKFSVTLAQIAADLASFRNLSTEDAIQKLTSGLVGQTEVLRQLGVIIDQETLKEAAFREGITETNRELTQQEKILATYVEILRQTEKAQGDIDRTSGSFANQTRFLSAQFEDLKATIGRGIIPVVSELFDGLSDLVFIVQRVGDGIDALADKLGNEKFDLLGGIIDQIFPGLDALDKLADALGKDKREKQENATITDLLADAQRELDSATDGAAKKMEQLADATLRVERAIADADRRVARAELTLFRAFEDAATRMEDAERDIAEAIEDRAEANAKAEQRVADVREAGNKAVRAARERLEEFERTSERQRIERTRRLIDLEKQRARAIVNANLDIQQAQIAGDAEAENRARRELAEAQDNTELRRERKDQLLDEAERLLDLEKLERDLHEARIERRKDLIRAQLEWAKVVEESNERLAEAERRRDKAQRDSDRAVADAQTARTDAIREGNEAIIDAQRAWVRVTREVEKADAAVLKLDEDMDGAVDTAEELADAIGDAAKAAADFFDPKGPRPGPPGLAGGGAMVAGNPYIVGEVGPELVIPQSNATVVSNEKLIAALREMMGNGGTARGGVVIQTGSVDERVLANEIMFRMAQDVVT